MSAKRSAIIAAACLAAVPALAKDPSYQGSVETVAGEPGANTVRGTVFLDANRNSRLDANETGVEGVLVSNGLEVVTTGADGTYELPAREDMNLFITKPADHAVPLNSDMIPQFYYVHKEEGSPELRFGGLPPTGPLPSAVNFPLIEHQVGDQFECLVFGDTQPYSNTEVGFVRESVGRLLDKRDLSRTECVILVGDVVGDDLSLYPRLKEVIAVGGVPQYWAAGNHDLDFDAESDQHSFDTFRREWGPEYYSFDIGQVHFVVLDNVRYPCNGVDPHDFCDPAAEPTYNGVIHDQQMQWLANDLAQVPEDRLIVLNTHIPLLTFTDNTAQKHQTDNLSELVELLGERRVLSLSGHTHTTENLLPGTSYEGWDEVTGVAEAPFHMIVAGAVSGSWWIGDADEYGVPLATQRLGSPRGYYAIDFNGADYVESYQAFGIDAGHAFHASFNTPRFRDWAETIISFAELYEAPSDTVPPVTQNDLGDMYLLTSDDLQGGTWLAVNVYGGSLETEVRARIDDGEWREGTLTQPGEGEAKRSGPEFADPLALARQSTQSDMAIRSARGGDETIGFRAFRGEVFSGPAAPFPRWLLSDNSQHLWRIDLPANLPTGAHTITIESTDRHGETSTRSYPFELVDELPNPHWPWVPGTFDDAAN